MTSPDESTVEIPDEPEQTGMEVVRGAPDGGVTEEWIEELPEYEDGSVGSRLLVRDDT